MSVTLTVTERLPQKFHAEGTASVPITHSQCLKTLQIREKVH